MVDAHTFFIQSVNELEYVYFERTAKMYMERQ